MQIIANSIFKRFIQTWIIRDFSFQFESGKRYGIAGPNGVGKSTLLQMLAGLIPLTKGVLNYSDQGKVIDGEHWYQHISFTAPYGDVYDYMNIEELTRHHQVFKKFQDQMSVKDFINFCYLKGHEHKLIKTYSSGMKQRLKLGLSVLSESPILFLDEPQSNLDNQAKDWYQNLMQQYTKDKLVIIASNEIEDFKMVDEIISLQPKQN
ncbi:MAG: ATP-binding cassette domain-containing protein [Saprospiraceae bacterium]|nr:ATP-binding cassette domain-containing protein [Saprospiraceae bacterium]MBK9721107.1 ATP-binding cassette domain-containing protein [Saprospiraceae bacterium]MBK9723263.1 ATP-binding cassette domain-containing protein [Saprospiraceae bacterium]